MYAREYARHTAHWKAHPDTVLRTFWEGNISLYRDRLLALDPPQPAELGRLYHADRDFGLRCQRAGLEGAFHEDLRGWHRFERSPEQFLRDARGSGRGLVLLHRAHPEELGPFTDETLLVHVRPPARPLVRACVRRPRLASVLTIAVGVLGRLGLYWPQRFTAHLRRVVEQLRSAHATQRALHV